jgi:hypothetical protein
MDVVLGSAWRAAICTSRSGTPASNGHDERGSQHVRMHLAQTGSPAD